MRLNNKTYEYLKQMVADMFVEYDIKGIPISAFEIATKMGLKIIPYSALDNEKYSEALKYSLDGFSVESLTGEWTIYYNDSRTYQRINQTIMHEVAHYFLGHTEEGEEEEAEAKFFAKYTLASPMLIRNIKVEKNIENIAEELDISRQAADLALQYYNNRLTYGPKSWTIYERQILNQLEISNI